MKTQFTHPAITNEETDEQIVLMLDTTRIVCPHCNGGGTHDRTDIDCSRLVDAMQEDGDEDGLEDYFNGGYSVTCEECSGRNVVDEIDWEKFQETHPKEYRKVSSWNDSEREDRRYAAQERMMGA